MPSPNLSAFLLHPRTNPAQLLPSLKGSDRKVALTHGQHVWTPIRAQQCAVEPGSQGDGRAGLCPLAPKPNACSMGNSLQVGLYRMKSRMGLHPPGHYVLPRGTGPGLILLAHRAEHEACPQLSHAAPLLHASHPSAAKPRALGGDSQEGMECRAFASSRSHPLLQPGHCHCFQVPLLFTPFPNP